MGDSLQFDLSAAEWRRNAADEQALLEGLAERLCSALPQQTEVIREHGLFVRHPRVTQIRVLFEMYHFQLTMTKTHGLLAERAKVVRGIRLKTEEMSFGEWLDALSVELSRMAAEHEDVQQKLYQFLMS
ncbi:hypothetical protein ACOJUR_06500 [Alicyclobacillus tolerans]|uniref:Uncharacterized protein n=2 Tax=Alicyclobacillus tolerans TaxID=90970 RepID=A0ABT9LVQ6_9BACL|nr:MULTISPECIES: hypothetical protein [Alicyclobacillus]MDP9728308.1 hypothetical protein [Alicyclobacillus tengchongensis]QRF23895.1 hypothetical protein FY534_09675 [Alicyclobacillus sp. TC]SHJ95121.1 hypothetical protein SAMN05443507_10646 [Alicyclobacillus montanus]